MVMNGKKNIVPIVMASDENYLFPTSVAMVSIMENGNEENEYIFYLLVKPELVGMDQGLFSAIKEKYSNFTCQYLTVPTETFKDAALTNEHITVETYYRLLISDLLPEYEKCLYLDGDIIVQCDVAELLNTDLEENYLAAIKDIGMQCGQGTYYTEHQKELEFDSMDSYFNAGILVLNLRQIRKDGMKDKFLKAIEKRYTIEDQDILNVTCLGRVHYLPVIYNMFTGFKDRIEFVNCGAYDKTDIEKIIDNQIKIIHYASGQDKPWKNIRCKLAYVWRKYAMLVPQIPLVEKEQKKINELENVLDFTALIDRCRNAKNIILYGYTYISRALVDRLESQEITQIRCFCDGNENKQGQEYKGIVCKSFEEVQKIRTADDIIVVCTQQAYAQVKEMLLQNEVDESCIMRYFWKDIKYYRSLDSRYYKHEAEQIYLEAKGLLGNTGDNFRKIDLEQFYGLLQDKQFISENYEVLSKYYVDEWLIKMPLISIVIPAYNAIKYIDRCLESVRKQTYSNWECIVIDDGSTDDTLDCLRNWEKQDRRFRIYTQKNKGMGPTRNRAISLAKGTYVTFVDSDDWVEPDYIKDMYTAILKKNADISKCNYYFHDMGQNGMKRLADITDEINVHDVSAYISPNMWSNLIDIRIFRDNNICMPGIPMEDMAIYPLLLLKAEKVVSIGKPLYNYQINTGNSVMDNIKNMEYYPKAVEYMLTEAKRLGLFSEEGYEDLFLKIVCYHMFGALNSRIKNNCDRKEYLRYKKDWVKFLKKQFPSFKELYDMNCYWLWGSYNLSRIIAYAQALNTYSLADKDLPYYFGFASIIPLMETTSSPCLPIHLENVVRNDMLEKERKHAFKMIEPNEDDYLVLDFLEERYDLFQLEDGNWLTKSEIWEESNYEGRALLKRESNECQEKWKNACDAFIKILDSKFQRDHIILAEMYLSPKCKNAAGRMLSWDDIEEYNNMIKKYYDYFKKKMDGIKILRIPQELNYTDGASKYGLAPSYLNYKAHKAMAVQLKELVNSNE